MNDATKNTPKKNKRSNPHDSAITHVSGKSEFIDDRPTQRGELTVALVYSEVPSGVLESIDTAEAAKGAPS